MKRLAHYSNLMKSNKHCLKKNNMNSECFHPSIDQSSEFFNQSHNNVVKKKLTSKKY